MEKYIIPNLRNACRVLDYLTQAHGPCTLRTLADELELPRTTAMRILNTLTQQGYTARRERGYALGPSLIPIGNAARDGLDLRKQARATLRRIADICEETTHLAIPSGYHSLIVDVCFSTHPLSTSRYPGALLDLNASATGKCFLAFRYFDCLKTIYTNHPLSQYTTRTKTQTSEIESDIKQTRQAGYALDDQEYYDGVRCVATPVFDDQSQCVAAIGLTASIARLPLEKTEAIANILKVESDRLSSELGCKRLPVAYNFLEP